jgi:hypothetical protein
MQSLYAVKLPQEIMLLFCHMKLLFLWLVALLWYRTSKCQPSSQCGNSKGKCSDARFASLIFLILKLAGAKQRLFRLPYYCPSKMAATLLHMGYQLPGLASRTLRTSWFLINSSACRNISTNEFTRFSTRWIVTTIPLTKPSVTALHIYLCVYITMENIQRGRCD